MNGRASIRGYLLQTIICLLDALQSDNEWESLTLEPDLDSEKVDIIWYYTNQKDTKVVQVKSSQNQITKKQVKKWAAELETSLQATSYELILIGPCSQAVVTLKEMGRVKIPTPRTLNVDSLIEQAAHRLGRYCEDRNVSGGSTDIRERLAEALVTRLESYSTESKLLSREAFEQLLDKWLYDAQRQAAGASADELRRLEERIERLLGEIPRIRGLHLDHAESVAWRKAVRRSLGDFDRLLPGVGYAQEYDKISWHPPSKAAEDTEGQRAMYARACNGVEGLLVDARQVIEEKLEEMQRETS